MTIAAPLEKFKTHIIVKFNRAAHNALIFPLISSKEDKIEYLIACYSDYTKACVLWKVVFQKR